MTVNVLKAIDLAQGKGSCEYIKGEAYERGHSSGYEEVLNETRNLVGKLK